MRIIPAIDIIGGQCVRLTKGAYNTKKVYSSNPLEVAKMFADKGFRYLHLVDLDGAKQGTPVNLSILESIASKTNLEIDYGGGLRTELSVSMAFDAGASAVTAGSVAVKNPTEVCSWLGRWGSSRIIIGADVIDGKLATEGWCSVENVDIINFISTYLSYGATQFICTDISRDGMLAGSALDLYARLLAEFNKIDLVASGGVASIKEVRELKKIGVCGAIVGKAIYEGMLDIDQLTMEV